jgi:transcriptional regulator with XRE-family HTH domain
VDQAVNAEKALSQRIRELRRRHFGPGGKSLLAAKLGISTEEYERFERGVVPAGEVLVRLCELTGEDLQWLLTGVASRGTVVISGARTRHRELLSRLAQLLDQHPQLAAPIEAFVDLLIRGVKTPLQHAPRLPRLDAGELIPILEPHELPLRLPEYDDDSDGDGALLLAAPASPARFAETVPANLHEPYAGDESGAPRPVEIVAIRDDRQPSRQFVRSPELVRCFRSLFAVRVDNDEMAPMFCSGDAVIAALGCPARLGYPALCRLSAGAPVRCRIWLGQAGQSVSLGRIGDGGLENVSPAEVAWALEALYRLTPAA